ncbi:helix-turn-helix transcriptional regulator [Litoribacillus peritrichatus]|uniref:Type III secretion system transcriptional regulator ExsA n=1 Tax=Litoribacillus peritrichatus TaxID=718191 RepID=A0ABP7N2W4_9GAMM
MKSISEYTQSNILVIPQALYSMKDASVVAAHRDSVVFYKCLMDDLENVEFYTNKACVVFIDEGREVLTNSSNTATELVAGHAVLLPKGLNLHSDFVKTTKSLKAFLVFFDDDLVFEFLSRNKAIIEKPKGGEHLCVVKDNGCMRAFFDSLQTSQMLGVASPAWFDIKLQELLHLLLALGAGGAVQSLLQTNNQKLPRRNLSRMLQNKDNLKLTVADLVHLSGRSLSSFHRDFKKIYNVPPNQWLIEQRLAYSKDLLLRQCASVTDVALSVGYENASHFIKVFKSRFGTTPKQYIENSKKVISDRKTASLTAIE